jgi:maltooligosyltrehalose trehalohydrolase
VRKGRKEEFKEFNSEIEAPDPQSPETFKRSKLQWDLLTKETHQAMLEYYKSLINLRKKEPVLKTLNRYNLKATSDAQANTLTLKRWCDEQDMICFMNFSNDTQFVTVPENINSWTKLFETADNEDSSLSISSGQHLTLKPESAIIYTQYHV